MSLDLAMSLRMGTKHGKHGGGPPPAYTGPLDLTATPAVVAYGQRAMKAAKLGTALYTIRRDSDDTTQSFNSGASDGTAPAAAISAFIGAGNGFVTTWTDQSGNAKNAGQATAAQQPQWRAALNSSLPSISFDSSVDSGNGQWLASATNSTIATTGLTFFAVYFTAGPGVMCGAGFGTLTGGMSIDFTAATLADGTTGNGPHYQYTDTPSFSALQLQDSTLDGINAPFSGTSRLDGVLQTVTDGGTSSSGAGGSVVNPFAVGTDDATGNDSKADMQLAELIVFNSILSDADRLAIRQNIATWYGITLS